jgi:hypothetical protein
MGLDELEPFNGCGYKAGFCRAAIRAGSGDPSESGEIMAPLWLLRPAVQTAVRLLLMMNKVRIIRRHDSNPISPFP